MKTENKKLIHSTTGHTINWYSMDTPPSHDWKVFVAIVDSGYTWYTELYYNANLNKWCRPNGRIENDDKLFAWTDDVYTALDLLKVEGYEPPDWYFEEDDEDE